MRRGDRRSACERIPAAARSRHHSEAACTIRQDRVPAMVGNQVQSQPDPLAMSISGLTLNGRTTHFVILNCIAYLTTLLAPGGAGVTGMTISKRATDRLLGHFPGPLMVGVSMRKYFFMLVGAGISVAAGIWFIQSQQALAALLLTPPRNPEVEGFLHLLIRLRVARDMPQAIAEIGWGTLIFGAIIASITTARLVCDLNGLWGLALDHEGFTVRVLRRISRHRWADVGDFSSLELSGTVRQRLGLFSKGCVVFNDYRAPESPIDWLRQAGRNRALIESYEYPAEVLAPAMSIWREWALEDRASQDGAIRASDRR